VRVCAYTHTCVCMKACLVTRAENWLSVSVFVNVFVCVCVCVCMCVHVSVFTARRYNGETGTVLGDGKCDVCMCQEMFCIVLFSAPSCNFFILADMFCACLLNLYQNVNVCTSVRCMHSHTHICWILRIWAIIDALFAPPPPLPHAHDCRRK